MERFCGHLLPAVKNRVRPYEHLDNYVQRRAQMQIVSHVYDMASLAKPRINYTYRNGERISSREKVYPECKYYIINVSTLVDKRIGLLVPNIVLGTPIRRTVQVTLQLTNQLTKYFGVASGGGFTAEQLRTRIDWTTLVRYGRCRLAGDGDRIRTADQIARDPSARDNSFVRVSPSFLLIHSIDSDY
jgi:hypothetical protein